MITSFNPPDFSGYRNRALIVGIAGLVLLMASVFIDLKLFFQAYLVGFTFWPGIAIGSLALLMLQHLTGGGWGLVIRRVLEAATRTLPVLALLFIPVIIGYRSLYPWANADYVHAHHLEDKTRLFLNLKFFVIRAVVYFVIWMALAF